MEQKIKERIKKGEILVDAKKIWREREDHNNNGNKEAGKWGRVRENDCSNRCNKLL